MAILGGEARERRAAQGEVGALAVRANGEVARAGGAPVMDERRAHGEAAAAPLVTHISPALLWHFDEAGWNVLGFEHIPGRAADYSPGSPDLDLVIQLMEALSRINVPTGHSPLKRAEVEV